MKRTREHQLEETSELELKKMMLEKNWIARKKSYDYGIDYEIQIVNDNELTEDLLWIQLKATDKEFESAKIKLQISTDSLKSYENSKLPVVIMYWIENLSKFYILFAQKYIKETLDRLNTNWREQKSVTLKDFHKMDDIAVLEQIATDGYLYIIKEKLGIPSKQSGALYWNDGILISDNEDFKKHSVQTIKLMNDYIIDKAINEWDKILLLYTLDIKERISVQVNKSICLYYLGKYSDAVELNELTIQIVKNIVDTTSLKEVEAILLGNSGMFMRILGRNLQAEERLQEAIEISIEYGFTYIAADHLNNLGVLYKNLGYYNKALDLFNKSLNKYVELKNQWSEAIVLGNIGVTYSRKENFLEAKSFINQSIDLNIIVGNKRGLSDQYGNVGLIYDKTGFQNNALNFFKMALELKIEIKDKKGEGICYGNIGLVYMHNNEPKKAIKEFTRSIEILRNIEYLQGVGEMLFNKGIALHYLKDIDASKECFIESIITFRNINNKYMQKHIWEYLKEINLAITV